MWIYDFDSLSWSLKKDELQSDNFLALRQDLRRTRLYAKCFSGAIWTNSSDLEDIFSPVGVTGPALSWGYSSQSGDYFSGSSGGILDIPQNEDFYFRWSKEFGLGKRSWFSPGSCLKSSTSTFEVDFATNKSLEDISSPFNSLSIDSVIVQEGSTILIKDQKTFVTFSATQSINIDEDFYYISKDYGQVVEYFYYNSQNGIYRYQQGNLVNITPSDYESFSGMKIYCSGGTSNKDKLFSPKRKKDGTFPQKDENIQFIESGSFMLKHKFEYNNLFEVPYNDILWEDQYLIGTYSKPESVLICGDRGTILLSISGTSSILRTKISSSLKEISFTNTHWWVCGGDQTLLKINKITLEIEYIDIPTPYNFNSISFWGNLYGCVVSSSGGIWITEDGGLNWTGIELEGIFRLIDLKKVISDNLYSFYIIGDRGSFFHLQKIDNQWIVSIKELLRIDSQNEREIVRDNLNFFVLHKTSNWILEGERTREKEFFVVTSDRDDLFIVDKNNFSNFPNLVLNVDFLNLMPKTLTFVGDDLVISGSNLISFGITALGLATQSSNIIRQGSWQVFSDKSYERVNSFQNSLWITGQNSQAKNYTYPGFTISFDYTKSFTDTLTPRFLFLNYDLATKVNFHDYSGTYRLPTPYTFSSFFTQGDFFEISSPPGQRTWVDYYKKSTLSFEYYSYFSQSNIIEFSTKFHFSLSPNSFFVLPETLTQSYLYQTLDPSSSSPVVRKLLPSTRIEGSSIWRGDPSLVDLNVSTPYNTWITENFILFKLNNYLFDGSVFLPGQVMYLSNSYFSANLPINKVVRGLNNNQTPVFIWLIHNFPEDVLDSFRNEGFYVENLNVFSSENILVSNFEKHPLRTGYKLGYTQSVFRLEAIYNNKTSYYNLSVDVNHPSNTGSLLYPDTFFNFGYTPNYSLEGFLSRINPDIFTFSKIFPSLVKLENVPALDFDLNNPEIIEATYSKVLVDDINLSNKIVFPLSLSNLYNSLKENIFYDLVIKTDNLGDFRTNKCLLTKKYTRVNLNWLVIEFNKPINQEIIILSGTTDITSVSILSRNTLEEISGDLRELDNINKNSNTKTIDYPDKFDILENEITSKFPTHNYFMSLLSDVDIRNNVTSVIWEDENSKLSNLILDPQGDPLLKIQPVDLSQVGSDKKQKNLIKISPSNIKIENGRYSLIDVDYSKARFKFTDGLTLEGLFERYPWIVESEVEDSLVGEDSSGLIFYRGLWVCGRWFEGTWVSGEWLEGDWYSGTWKSNNISLNDGRWTTDPLPDNTLSIWHRGRWFDGTWEGGTWRTGRKYQGVWKGGNWNSGIWNDGVWEDGRFQGGVWVDGDWMKGSFNGDISPSYWLDGKFKGGDFENGRWFNGKFSGNSFGSRSTNYRKSIWESGNWLSGNFYSSRNLSSVTGEEISLNHKLSQFKSGNWQGGDFWGGTCFNINFRQGVFRGGIIDDIEVIGIRLSQQDRTEILLNGTFRFSYPYDIWLMAMWGSPLSVFGTIERPKIYKILFSETSLDNTTIITLSGQPPATSPWKETTDLRVVSKFEGSRFLSGLWYNGIFEGGNFEGGMWHNGKFKGKFGQ